MKIRDLLAAESIELNGKVTGKKETLDAMVDLMSSRIRIQACCISRITMDNHACIFMHDIDECVFVYDLAFCFRRNPINCFLWKGDCDSFVVNDFFSVFDWDTI